MGGASPEPAAGGITYPVTIPATPPVVLALAPGETGAVYGYGHDHKRQQDRHENI